MSFRRLAVYYAGVLDAKVILERDDILARQYAGIHRYMGVRYAVV
jgi:hypothetical protein